MIVLVDLGALYWRHWYATKSGIEAYSLTVDVLREVHDTSEKAVVCCDAPPLLRKARFPEYKANREAKPPEAVDSLRAVEEQVESWGMPIVRVVGYEADDLIGTLARQAREPVRIHSHDKDLYQLITDTVVMVKKAGETIDTAETVRKFGVRPNQIRDYLALVGDAADNVPGCPNVGPGRARDLLQRFGTLDAVRAATDEELRSVRGVGEKTLTGIREWDPALAVELVSLAFDVPVSLDEIFKTETTTTEPVFTW